MTTSMRAWTIGVMAVFACLAQTAGADVQIRVRVGEGVGSKLGLEPGATIGGRVVVALARSDAKLPPGTEMIDAPFWDDWQPMFGVDAAGLKDGSVVEITDAATPGRETISELAPGTYRAAAWLIRAKETGDWKATAGNLFSPEARLDVTRAGEGRSGAVELVLGQITEGRGWDAGAAKDAGVELVEIESRLLTEFHGRKVMLRAGVVTPTGMDAARTYAAVYEVPGFGGDHTGALEKGRRRGEINREAFWIVLDPESPNGHTLFADSDNNGPWARALIEELIPAIEARYPMLRRDAPSRLLRGHSSGGWSVIWLGINHPETFGRAWSTAPDPVDFRRFQTVDIYSARSMYRDDPTKAPAKAWEDRAGETPSYQRAGRLVMTVRQENMGEHVLGPGVTSGQQWHSWQAVFGPREGGRGWGKGRPVALYDPRTGEIDREVAETYRRFDIGEWVRANPRFRSMIFASQVRLVVGDADSFFLNQAVELLKTELDQRGAGGGITIVPGADHSNVLGSEPVRGFEREMLAFIRERAKAKDAATPAGGDATGR